MSLSEFPHHSASQIPSSPPPRHSLDNNTMNRHHTMVTPVTAYDARHEQHLERQQQRRDRISVPHRISVPNRRYNYRDPHSQPPPTPSSYYSSLSSTRSSSKQSSSDMIELLFTKLLDALIFTSAIAITAYNYWTGSLNNSRQQGTITAGPSSASSSSSSTPPRTPLSPMALQFPSTIAINDNRSSWRQQQYNMHKMYDENDPQHQHHKRHSSATSPLEDSRRKRTLKWAESVSHQQHKPKTCTKEREYNPDDNNDDDTSSSTSTIRISRSSNKRRTQSLPPAPFNMQIQNGAQDAHEKEEEMFNRMEERLQSLIQQGQAALSSQVDVDDHLDENEIAMRRAFAARKKYSF